MATAIKVDPKKIPVKQVDRPSRDGLAGMSYNTKKHFVTVQNKMFDYVNQQEVYEYDQKHAHPRDQHHHQQFNRVFVDEKKAPKTRSQPSTPVGMQKPTKHLGVPTSHTDQGHHKGSPRARVK